MSLDWLAIRTPPIEACEHGVRENSRHFQTIFVGPRTWDRIDYPTAMVLPVDSSRTGGNEYQHRVDVMMVHERNREYDYIEDVLHPAASVIIDTLQACRADDSLVTYYPTVVEDFAGKDESNTSVLGVRVQFEMSSVIDMAEAGAADA